VEVNGFFQGHTLRGGIDIGGLLRVQYTQFCYCRSVLKIC